MTRFIRHPEDLLNVSEENVERIREQSMRIDLSSINDNILELARTLSEAKWSTQPRILLELCMVRLASGGDFESLSTNRINSVRKGNAAESIQAKKADSEGLAVSNDSQGLTAPEASEVPKASNLSEASKESRPLEETLDIEQIWSNVIEEGESQKGTFNILRRGGRLLEVGEDCFRLELGNDMALRYAKDNADYIKMLMEKYTGKKLGMDCSLADRNKKVKKEKTAEELACELGNCLSINIEVK